MKKKLRVILSFIFVSIMVVSLYFLIMDFNRGEDENVIFSDSPEEIIVSDEEKEVVEIDDREYVKMSPDVDLAAKRKEHNNNDIIGRLELPNLFNILIVRGSDNSYYLNYSVNKTKDIRGSEFMDYRVTPTSKQINIYGHNSRDVNVKVPFLKLEQFLDKTYFDNNPYIIFQYDEGKSVYKIMSIKEVTTNQHMTVNKTGTDFIEQVNYFRTNAIYTRDVPFDESSDIIVLQTCSHHLDNAYYLITGIKIEYKTEE